MVKFKKSRILVLGDAMIDEYMCGFCDRLSPEASAVPVVEITQRFFRLGGASNVAANLRSLGMEVWLGCVIGIESGKFLTMVKDMKIHSCIDTSAYRKTTIKTRIISGNRHIVRVDQEDRTVYTEHDYSKFPNDIDAVVFSDYAKGYLSPQFCKDIINKYKNKIIVVDPKTYDYMKFRGCTVFKPNKKELFMFAGEIKQGCDSLTEAQSLVYSRLQPQYQVTTLGRSGMSMVSADNTIKLIPNYSNFEAIDITGAGDTVSAVLTVALCSGLDIYRSIDLASFAADIKVRHLGNYSVTLDDFKSYMPRKLD